MKSRLILSKRSIDRLIRQTVPKWQRKTEAGIMAILAEVAQAGVVEAAKYFGYWSCYKEAYPDGTGFYVNAEGSHVCFVEFGTGVYTDADHEYASKVNIGVYPGSWSEKHAQTWQAWLAAGKDPYAYPYNHRPKYGMMHAMHAMRRKLEEYTL